MKTVLSLFLLAAAAGAQVVTTVPGLDLPKTEKPAEKPAAAPAAGRGAAPAPATAGRGRGAAPSAVPAAANTNSPKDLKFPPLRSIQPPPATTFTLPSGLKVYFLEDHELPVVGGIALVRTGGILDPPQRIGLAQLAGVVLRTGGTALKTGEQIDNLLDTLASSLESSIRDSIGSLSFAGLKESAPTMLQVFKETIAQPGFRQDKVDLAKTQLRAAISHRNDSGINIAHREFSSLIFGKDSPFGWQPEYATLDRISRNDLRAFHQRYFAPSNVLLGVWGDFNAVEMKASIEKIFGDWTVPPVAAPEFPKVKKAPSPGIFLVERKDNTQSFIAVGHLGGVRADKDCAALETLTGLLGGGPASRIGDRLRNKSRIAADVRATWGAGWAQPGLFEISGTTAAISTVAAIKAIQEEIERVRTTEVTEDEFRLAREAALNNLAFVDDTRAKLFARQMTLDYYGYPADFLAQLQKALQSMTRADLLRVAKQYLNPADLTIVVVGNPIMFGEPLEKLGPVAKLDISIPEAKAEVVVSTDASLAEGKQILSKAQAAAGGAEKLAAVKDYTMLAEYSIDPSVANVGGSKIVQTDKWVAPTTFRQDSTLPAGRVTAYTDGKVGWISTPQGWGALSGVQRSQVFGDLFRVYYRLLLSERIEGRTVNAIDATSVQITDTTGQVTTVEFDPQTNLPRRVAYDTQQAGGAPIYSEDVYEDFREVDGIKVPFKFTINQGGRRFSEVLVKDYKINTGLKPLELARRPQ